MMTSMMLMFLCTGHLKKKKKKHLKTKKLFCGTATSKPDQQQQHCYEIGSLRNRKLKTFTESF